MIMDFPEISKVYFRKQMTFGDQRKYDWGEHLDTFFITEK